MSDPASPADDHSDAGGFQQALSAKLSRNRELDQQRQQAEKEMDRAQREAAERDAEEARRQQVARDERHAELVEGLRSAAEQLKAADSTAFVVRLGFTESGEEYIAKISTRGLTPARSLFVELDHDDDEVLARWHSDLGDALELWRLLEVTPDMLQHLVLQAADQELWASLERPPAFPGDEAPLAEDEAAS